MQTGSHALIWQHWPAHLQAARELAWSRT